MVSSLVDDGLVAHLLQFLVLLHHLALELLLKSLAAQALVLQYVSYRIAKNPPTISGKNPPVGFFEIASLRAGRI